MSKSILWSEEEVLLLKEKYPVCSKEELLDLFSNRSYRSIHGKAEKLKLKKLDSYEPWNDEDKNLLIQNYEIKSKDELLKLFPNRSWIAIQSQSSKMNLRKYNKYKDKRTIWTDEKLDKLVSDRDFELIEVFKDKNNRKMLKVKCQKGHITDIPLDRFQNGQECTVCTGKAKIPFNEVVVTIEENGYKLISQEKDYQNASTLLEVVCPNNHKYKVSFSEFKSGKRCQKCYFNRMGEGFLLDFNIVKERFLANGFIIEDDDKSYKGVNSKLDCKCLKHLNRETLSLSYYQVVSCKVICPYCKEDKLIKKYSNKYRKIYDKFSQLGLELLTIKQDYIQMKLRAENGTLEFICKKHKFKGVQHLKLRTIRQDNESQLCRYCVSPSGENHHKWKGGISNLNEYLRKKIQPWKIASFKKHGFKCDITGVTKNLIIHHKYSFSDIVKETLKELNLEIKSCISEYSTEELEIIEQKCLELHFFHGLGICLSKKVHDIFHEEYSLFYFSSEDYDDFKLRVYNGEFEDVLMASSFS